MKFITHDIVRCIYTKDKLYNVIEYGAAGLVRLFPVEGGFLMAVSEDNLILVKAFKKVS